jgi:hypothetical protein
MPLYSIRVTQLLSGYYEGDLEIEAVDLEAARRSLESLSNVDIDNIVSWQQGYEMDGDRDTIEFHGELTEI